MSKFSKRSKSRLHLHKETCIIWFQKFVLKFIFWLFFPFLFSLSSSMHYHSHCASSWLLNILCLWYLLYTFVQSCFTIFFFVCIIIFLCFFNIHARLHLVFFTIFVACFSTSFWFFHKIASSFSSYASYSHSIVQK